MQLCYCAIVLLCYCAVVQLRDYAVWLSILFRIGIAELQNKGIMRLIATELWNSKIAESQNCITIKRKKLPQPFGQGRELIDPSAGIPAL
jgi:hypothetical protein